MHGFFSMYEDGQSRDIISQEQVYKKNTNH
jgi:hypothetical protein